MSVKITHFILTLFLLFSYSAAAETVNFSLESIKWGKPGGGGGYPVGLRLFRLNLRLQYLIRLVCQYSSLFVVCKSNLAFNQCVV